MNANDYQILQTTRADRDDAAYLAWVAETVITLAASPVIVTYQTLRAKLGKAKVDVIAAVLEVADPIGHQVLFTTGVDINFSETQMMLAALPTATQGNVTESDCDLLRDLGRTVVARWQTLGLSALPVQSDLDQLPVIAAVEARIAQVEAFHQNALNEELTPLLGRAQAGEQVAAKTMAELVTLYGGG